MQLFIDKCKTLGQARYWLVIVAGIFALSGMVSAQENNPTPLFLQSVLNEASSDQGISKGKEHEKTLIVGVSQEIFEPYEMIQAQNLKGIVAEYLAIIGKKLNYQIKVLAYPNKKAAIKALLDGEIDLFTRSSTDFPAQEGLAQTIPYILNYPVIVGREAELEFSKIKPEGDIGFAVGYISFDELSEHFQKTKLTAYNSTLPALHAVEYRKQAWFIGDPTTTSFYIGKGELSQLHIYPLKTWKKFGYSFLLRSDQKTLLASINETLTNTSSIRKGKILKYWSTEPEDYLVPTNPYTREEQAWLATNPEVKVAVNGALPPYSYYDDNGEIKGAVVDLLSKISQNTGINFTLIDYPVLSALENSLITKNTDMALTLLPNAERESYLKFTEPYLFNSFALITGIGSEADSLQALKNKRVAIQRSNFVADKISKSYPGIELIKKESQLDSLIAVANGEADAAVTLLPTATYLIRQYFSEDLKVATSLPDFQANLPFSVRTEQKMLYDVMRKSIEQLKPGYIASLMNNWKSTPPAKKSVWRDYINSYKKLSMIATLVAILMIILIIYLIAKRHRALRDIEHFELRSTLLDSIPLAISVRDLEGRFVFCNQVFYSQLRISPEDVIGRLTSEFMGLPADQAKEQERLYFQVLEKGIADQRQLDAVVNGFPLTFRQWDRPFTDKRGHISGLISGYADVTSSVLLLQQLREAHDHAVQANEAKSRFLAVMSHEIRTPLNAIIGLLELTIQRLDLGGSCDRDDLEVAYGSSRSLIELIDDILDLAKIESGKLSLMPARCNIMEVIHSVNRIFSGVARQKGLYLRFNQDANEVPDLSLDAGRMKQILSNLLSNAIKFTDAGGVTVNIHSTRTDQGISINIQITDTGIGISSDDQIKLFKPFSQVNAPQHSRGGTGLGLAICRQLVEMMGGDLELRSTPGQGTQVAIVITAPELEPLEDLPVASHEKERAVRQQLNVLLVDDHPANRLLLGQQLEFLGHKIQEAEDGAQAFEIAKSQKFDLIITDCSMPIMDGYQLTREWRNYEALHDISPCWILGFTANAQPEERVRCVETGMDGCLFKPVSLAELESCLANLEPRISNPSRTYISPTEKQPLFDNASIDGLTGGDTKLAHMLVVQLHDSNKLDLEQLKSKIQEKQWKEIAALAHRLKGVARLINSAPLITATTNYEQAFSDQDEETKLAKLSKNMTITLETLQAALLNKIQQHIQTH